MNRFAQGEIEIPLESMGHPQWRVYLISDPQLAVPLQGSYLRLIDEDQRVECILAQRMVRFGRGNWNDLPFDWPQLSRGHCLFEYVDGAWWVRDGGSRNGCFLNGVRVLEAELKPGDSLMLADRHFAIDTIAVAELLCD